MSEKEIAIKVENVSMHFNMASEKTDNLKEYVVKMLKHQLFFKDFVAVDNVSFEVKKGEVFGIVGTNGSGKSTLLKMVSGILEPTTGKITTNGVIAPLIELGAGFDGELTARENIFLNGAVLGFEKEFIEEKFTDIVDFAELWDFLDMPIKNYSSGMVARIAFAIATVVKPEILIVDEILAVGDFLFQQKCEKRIKELMAGGTTVLIVSHSIGQIEKLCDRVLWIEKGKPRMIGNTFEVCNAYNGLQNLDGYQNLHEYQIVQTEKCSVCGQVHDFRSEPKMTYHTEAFCAGCGAAVRLSDMAEVMLNTIFEIKDGSVYENKEAFSDKKILISCGNSSLANILKEYDTVKILTGSEADRVKQIENIEEYVQNKKFDIVIIEEMFPCVKDYKIALRGIYRILNDGGYLVMDLPIHEGHKTKIRSENKHKLYRNGLLLRGQWGDDAPQLFAKQGFETRIICKHRWYSADDQIDVDKEYEKCVNSHPYFIYKFNSWVLIGKKE